MIAKELITDSVSTLHTSDTAIYALSLMEEYRISHMPIVNNEDFLGLISETDLYELADLEAPVGAHTLTLRKPFVTNSQHIYEVIKLADEFKLSIIPVLDDKHKYLGVIRLADLTHYFAQLVAVDQPGGLITLEMNIHDYSVSQIGQIVESNDARILSLYFSPIADTTKIEVSIKINKSDLTPIIQTFSRYNYTIVASIFETDEEELQDRYDSLMSYLNV
ncbi:MAG: CBS domain-containing protein [Bacteroidales bacterium]|nr:CBS domain-containing protein [Bacteroidales bacterium]